MKEFTLQRSVISPLRSSKWSNDSSNSSTKRLSLEDACRVVSITGSGRGRDKVELGFVISFWSVSKCFNCSCSTDNCKRKTAWISGCCECSSSWEEDASSMDNKWIDMRWNEGIPSMSEVISIVPFWDISVGSWGFLFVSTVHHYKKLSLLLLRRRTTRWMGHFMLW